MLSTLLKTSLIPLKSRFCCTEGRISLPDKGKQEITFPKKFTISILVFKSNIFEYDEYERYT